MTDALLHRVRHASELGDWEMATRPATRALQPFVKNYTWYIDRASRISRRIQVPHTKIVLIIALGTRMRVVDPRVDATRERRLGTYVAGLFDRQVFTEYDGVSEGIQVDFTPLGAQRLLGISMTEVTNTVVTLSDILGSRARQFEEQLLDTPGLEARMDLVEAFILRRMAESEPAPQAIDWAVRQIHVSGGKVSIGSLAEATGQGHKRLIANFREHVGMPPGTISRLVRFERAVAGIHRDRVGARLSEIALDAGYYDQSHFNREFRAFSGLTPLAYAARLLPEGGGVSGE